MHNQDVLGVQWTPRVLLRVKHQWVNFD